MAYEICWKEVNSDGVVEVKCGVYNMAHKSTGLLAIESAKKVNKNKEYFLRQHNVK